MPRGGHNKGTGRVSECHPDRKHQAFGLCAACYMKDYGEKNPDTRYRLRGLSGFTERDYKRLFQQQKGCCLICSQKETSKSKGKVTRLAVDHDHTTGKIRGLLCRRCNRAIGLFEDSPELLFNALHYLEEHVTYSPSERKSVL